MIQSLCKLQRYIDICPIDTRVARSPAAALSPALPIHYSNLNPVTVRVFESPRDVAEAGMGGMSLS